MYYRNIAGPTRVDARGRPDWVPALVGNISCKTVKQYEISDHAELLN